MENDLEITIVVFDTTPEVNIRLENILADIQALLGNNYSINGSVMTCIYQESEMWNLNSVRPNCAMNILFDSHYRQYRGNPTEQV